MASPAKKRSAAARRIPSASNTLASRGFEYAGARTGTSAYTVMVQCRIDEDLADRVAAFANDRAMSPSESIRHLLEAGLEKEKKRK